jgi:hypothetical protein
MPIVPPSAEASAYTFLRYTGFILDELSVQGLVLWLEDDNRWHCRWQGTDLKLRQGFLALVGVVISRFSQTFSISSTMDYSESAKMVRDQRSRVDWRDAVHSSQEDSTRAEAEPVEAGVAFDKTSA